MELNCSGGQNRQRSSVGPTVGYLAIELAGSYCHCLIHGNGDSECVPDTPIISDTQ